MKYSYNVCFQTNEPGITKNYSSFHVLSFKVDNSENYNKLINSLEEAHKITLKDNNFAITSLSFLHEINE